MYSCLSTNLLSARAACCKHSSRFLRAIGWTLQRPPYAQLKDPGLPVQFWYTEETASVLAKEVVEAAGPSGRIACIACPSLFRELRAAHPDANAHLFEVDLRFEVVFCLSQNSRVHVRVGRAPTGRALSRSIAWQGHALLDDASAQLSEYPCLLSCLSMLLV